MVLARVLMHGANLLNARANLRSGGSRLDLDTAIQNLETALHILKTQRRPSPEALRAAVTNNMVRCLAMRFVATGGRKIDSQALIGTCAAARETLPPGFFHLNMSVASMTRHEFTKSPRDFHLAFTHAAKAVLAKINDNDCAHQLQALANMYVEGCKMYKKRPCLQFRRARIRVIRPFTTKSLPQQLRHFIRTATSVTMVCLAVPTCQRRDLDTGLLLLKLLATIGSDWLMRRLAATLLGTGLCYLKKWSKASAAFDQALALLPTATLRISSLQDSLSILESLHSLGSQAAGAALRVNQDALKALTSLERGRCCWYDAALQSRPMQSSRQDLVNHRNAVQAKINAARTQQQTGLSLQNSFPQTVILGSVIERIESDIQGHPAVEGFQRPLTEDELKSLAAEGPILCCIANQAGSYLIAVTPKGIRVKQLKGLTELTLRADVRLMTKPNVAAETEEALRSRNKNLSRILGHLWKRAVRAIFQDLGLIPLQNGKPIPRVWWTSSDLLGLLPIHAAGLYHDYVEPKHKAHSIPPGWAEKQRAVDFVVSSYTPSLRLLQQARRKRKRTTLPEKEQCRVLMVAMPRTAGYADLDVAEDVQSVRRTLETAGWPPPVVLESPRKAEVLTALRDCHIVIFACHGTANNFDPTRSGLLLGTGESGSPETLTVTDLQDLDLKHARLACLLACTTATNSARWLRDECIHVAGGFQLAGFSEVIATLDTVSDWVANKVTRALISEIIQRRSEASFAEALHSALRKVLKPDNVVQWSPFVHFGP